MTHNFVTIVDKYRATGFFASHKRKIRTDSVTNLLIKPNHGAVIRMNGDKMDFWMMLMCAFIFYFSAVAHELSHGFAACKIGDKTALFAGRLSFNPIKNFSWVGTVIVPCVLLLGGSESIFWWVKNVTINFSRFSRAKKTPRILAGVFTNAILAICGFNLFLATNNLMTPESAPVVQLLCVGLFMIFPINVLLSVFHLLPIPNLDGWKLIKNIGAENTHWMDSSLAKVAGFFISIIIMRVVLIFIKPLMQMAIYWGIN